MVETYSKIKKKVSIIIKVIDVFTGLAIKNALVTVDGSSEQFINKKDGFYVLLNSSQNEYFVNISFAGYISEKITILNEDNLCNKIHLVSLLPKYDNQSFIVKGKIPLYKEQRIFYAKLSKKQERIVRDSGLKDDTITITKSKDIQEGYYFIDSKEGEIVNVSNSKSEDGYEIIQLEEPLQKTHKMGDYFLKAYSVKTDNKGNFELIVPERNDVSKIYILKNTSKEIHIYKYDIKNNNKEIDLGEIKNPIESQQTTLET